MRIINDETVYDSFEEISQILPIGSQEEHIITMNKWTWDEEELKKYIDYNQITTCTAYIYNGDYWKPSFSTVNIKIREYSQKRNDK